MTVGERVRSELDRTRRRVRNAARHVAGPRAAVGQTPRRAIWRSGRATLWRYDTDAELWPPLLLVHSLVSKAVILDLQPGNSFVERTIDAGFAPYLLDFGTPDARDAGNTLETYCDVVVPAAIARVREDADTEDLLALGYCFGGNLLQLAMADPDSDLGVRAFAAMAVPVDYHAIGMLAQIFRTGTMDPTDLLDATGNLPTTHIDRAFRTLKPTNRVAAYAELLDHLDDDRWLHGYYAMARWIDEQVPFPGAALLDTVELLIRDNALVDGGPVVGGRRRDPAAITCPVLVIAAEDDHIVPLDAALPDTTVYGGDVDVLRAATGHVALVAGRTAATETNPQILDWLADHADGAT